MGILTGTLEAILVLVVAALLTALAVWSYWRRRLAALDQAYDRQHQAELAGLTQKHDEQLKAELAALRQELDARHQTGLAILRQESDKQHQADVATLRQEFERQHQSEIRDLVREFRHQAANCLRPMKDHVHQMMDGMQALSINPCADRLHSCLKLSDSVLWRQVRLTTQVL